MNYEQNENVAGTSEIRQNARELRESVDDPKFVYSKVSVSCIFI